MRIIAIVYRFMVTLHFYLLQVFRFAQRRPQLAIGLAVILFVLGLFGASKLQYLTNIDDLGSSDFKSYETNQKLNRSFTDKNLLVFVLSPPKNQIPNKTDFCLIQTWIQRGAVGFADITQINSTLGLRSATWTDLKVQFKPWLDLNCDNNQPEQDLIEKAYKKIHESPWSAIMTSKLSSDITLLFQIKDNATDKRFGAFDAKVVDEIEVSLRQNFLNSRPDWTLHRTGNASFLRYLKIAYDQTQLINLLLVVTTLVFFFLFFGSWRAGFLFILTLIFALIPIYFGMAMTSTPIDLLTNAIPLLATVSCLEDYVFVLFLQRSTKNWRTTFRRLLLPSFLTSLTTAIGFGSLFVSNIEMIARFGLWSAALGMLEWTQLFIVLPALFKVFPSLGQFEIRDTKFLLAAKKLSSYQPKNKKLTLLTLIVIPLSLFFANKVTIADFPEATFSKSHPVYETSAWLKVNRGWQGQVSLVFNTKSDAEQKNILQKIKQDPLVVDIEDKFTTLQYLTQNLDGFRAELTESIWKNSPFSNRLIAENQTERALIYTKSTEINEIEAFRQSIITRICANQECELGGSLVVYSEFGLQIFKTLFDSLGLSLILVAIILVLCCYHCKNLKQSLFIVATSVWGPLALLLYFSLTQTPLFYATSICISIFVGLSGDNAIQFLYQKKGSLKQSVQEVGPASLVISFGMIMITFLFFLSDFAALQKLGIIMISGILLMLIGDVYLLKGLLNEKSR